MRTDEGFDIPGEDPSERALDALLARARFSQASAESQQRLRSQWISLSRKPRIRPTVWMTSAAAAMIVVVAGMSVVMWRTKPIQDGVVVGPKMLVTSGNDEPKQIWREPTMAERWVALRAAKAAHSKPQAPAADPVVGQLVQQLGDPLVDRRFQAARELAKLPQQPQVVATLSSMVQRDVNRREALAALILCKDPVARKVLDDASRSSGTVNAQITALKHEMRKSS